MAECPSIQELVDAVKSLTREKEGDLQTAWSDSFPDSSHCCEQGGFIYVGTSVSLLRKFTQNALHDAKTKAYRVNERTLDDPIPEKLTRVYVVRAPKGDTMNQKTKGKNAAIDLNKPGIKQDNVILGQSPKLLLSIVGLQSTTDMITDSVLLTHSPTQWRTSTLTPSPL